MMDFNRRSFMITLLAAYGAAPAPSLRGHKPKPQSDELHYSVTFEDEPEAIKAAMNNLKVRLSETDLTGFGFFKMDLPKGVEYASNEMMAGIPVRHVRAYDPIRDKVLNRIDVTARRCV